MFIYLHSQVLKTEAYSAGDLGTAVHKAFFRYMGPHSDFAGPTCGGSTACVALIRDNQLVVGNAGDSRCVISRGGQVELCDDDDFIVVACDGICDCMSSQQLVDFIHEHINMVSAWLSSEMDY
ncbi:hypothetical protein PR202_gb06370 [Eleusine coracana subsp. coracana]|uniref:protein-serine/threonine phosphatase n=1 Tax=Eleusine coracana subsp. coracana TaxID=191504 RepID=A0AAV5E983_ELECO|nr:hypothetical protein PR202_gb06370 [Eleusine coracana subsp. coracana]